MARKTLKKPKATSKRKVVKAARLTIPEEVKLNKETQAFIAKMEALGENLEEGTMEYRTFHSYIEALIRYESAWSHWMSLGENPKDMDYYNEIGAEVSRRQAVMFRAFDGWQAAQKHTIHVPENELRQIVYDALMANVEAMPEEYAELTGLERGREFKRVADDLIGLLKTDRVKVTEQDMDAAYCPACLEEISA